MMTCGLRNTLVNLCLPSQKSNPKSGERAGVNAPNLSEPTAPNDSLSPRESPEKGDSMEEYYQLKKSLQLVTVAITGIIFISVWLTYSLNTALNYLLGACVGVSYLRMLAKDIERLGVSKNRLGSGRLALFVGLMIIATRWQQLQILPIFLGFITYKAAIILYVLQTTLVPTKK